MRVLYIDGDYYYYPNGISDLDTLSDFLNKNYSSFIKLTRLDSDHTVPPFFIDEFKSQVILNVSSCSTVEEVTVTIMSRDDYSTSLKNAVDEVCMACDSFNPEKRTCDCGEIQENMCLNGKCDAFCLDEDFESDLLD